MSGAQAIELDARKVPTGARREVEAATVQLGDGTMANALDDAYRLHDGSADRSFLLRGVDGEVERSVRIDMGDGYAFAQAYAPPGGRRSQRSSR